MEQQNRTNHILIVEDDPAVARSLQDGLEREGYTVTWKASGRDGMAFARDHRPDLVIDCDRSQVRRGDRLLNLTPTEFRLLAYLARHPQQALSRAQILDAVWGYDADVESERTVTVHVRRLREKVELDPSRPSQVLTVPGIGYRLAE